MDGADSPDGAGAMLSDAEQLFTERASAIDQNFSNRPVGKGVIADICAGLDGLPLAIEMAAARTYLMTPDELLDRLDQRLLMLTGAARDFPARQQTMRDALAWSYDLLEPEEQMVLRRLAVFVGSWSLDAAAEICWDLSVDRDARNSANLPVIESLVQKSLVFRSSHLGQPAPDGATRFRLLETVREFADVELFRTDELELIRERHTAYYASAAARLECIAWGDEPGDSRAILAAEYGNFHAALLWAIEREQTELAFQIVAAVFNPEATQDLSRILGQDTHSQLEFVR